MSCPKEEGGNNNCDSCGKFLVFAFVARCLCCGTLYRFCLSCAIKIRNEKPITEKDKHSDNETD